MDTATKSAQERAAAAEAAVRARHLHRLLGLPGTRIAAIAWPPGGFGDRFGPWHYWWHAHLVDLLVDAAIRTGHDDGTVARLIRGVWLRNLTRWTNNYYDDMAWMGLAVERADRHLGLDHRRAVTRLADRMYEAWVPTRGGGIPWRTADLFFNAPANGPAAILLARTGQVERAVEMCDWMHDTLRDPESGLIIDGVKPGGTDTDGASTGGEASSPGERVTALYTYCQGVVLGAELEVLRATGDQRHADRIADLVAAVETRMTTDGVIHGAGGGDGGLFAGILARYLALVATDLPDPTLAPDADPDLVAALSRARVRAADIVVRSADAAWAHRAEVDGSPLFGADWNRPSTVPTTAGTRAVFAAGAVASSSSPERDMSVQLSGWMVLEAATAVDLHRPEHVQTVSR